MTKRKQPPIECRLRPNYTKKCIACGHGPVVDVYTRDGHFVNSTSCAVHAASARKNTPILKTGS